ncbi:MAG: acetate--CoA ligase [Deltaproteobacteria bacterium]|nr:acetate--CoA ligase [Deltaproteobacteria bacterium]
MPIAAIEKPAGAWRLPPNLRDYDQACRGFSWQESRRALAGLPGGRGLNIAHEAVDRHAAGPLASRVALRFLSRDGVTREISFRELAEQTNRFANLLRELGVGKGERVFALAGRVPELWIAALGTLKNGSVFCPLFSAFGPEPIRTRLERGDGRVLVTSDPLYTRKVEALRPALPKLAHALLVGRDASAPLRLGTHDLGERLAAASPSFEIPPTSPDDPALLHFTSGTTGAPKGAVHVHAAVVAHRETARLALDLQPDDIFWCTADPGWVTGTSYGIVAPLSLGVTCVVDEAEFDAERWYEILERERVSNWYTAPTAVRMLMRAGSELAKRRDLSRLRFVASVGEPLNPEAVLWGQQALGLPIHDNWWQTETGGIMIANFASQAIRPGSMGRPLPGIEAAIVARRPDGGVDVIAEPEVTGELALRAGWPSMFRGYLHDEQRYQKCFADGWYLSGDLVRRDRDGYYWFVGRADDVIKSAGHLIGPFEVESALMEHPAVIEAAVIGRPDPVAGESVKAFVVLRSCHEATPALVREIHGFARSRLGAAVAPKEIEIRDAIPKTRSGKIMRRLLRARELGLPEGDTSTLESGA